LDIVVVGGIGTIETKLSIQTKALLQG